MLGLIKSHRTYYEKERDFISKKTSINNFNLHEDVFATSKARNTKCRHIAHMINGIMFFLPIRAWAAYTGDKNFTISQRLSRGDKYTRAQCLGLEKILGSRTKKQFNQEITCMDEEGNQTKQ